MVRMGTKTGLVVALLAVALVNVSALVQDSQQEAGQLAGLPFDQAEAVAQLKGAIAGKEDTPAVEVFKNIQQYKGVTAARLVRIMEFGFTRSLGVDCTHCHVPGQWDLDDKPTKQIAREMSAMVGMINNEYLKKIPNLKSTNPSVNCTTCHRGQTRPALELPDASPVKPLEGKRSNGLGGAMSRWGRQMVNR